MIILDFERIWPSVPYILGGCADYFGLYAHFLMFGVFVWGSPGPVQCE